MGLAQFHAQPISQQIGLEGVEGFAQFRGFDFGRQSRRVTAGQMGALGTSFAALG